MKLFKVHSINTKLCCLVLLAVLPALLILLHSGIEQRRDSIATAKHDVRLLTHAMAKVQSDISRSTRHILTTLALLPEIQAVDVKAATQLFRAVLRQYPDHKNISLVDLNGDIVASALPFAKTNLADRKHFIEALQRKNFAVGEYIVTRVGSTDPALPFAYPVLNTDNEPVAVLTTTIDLAFFAKFYNATTLPDNSFIAVTDHQGVRLLYYPTKEGTNPIGQPIKGSAWETASRAKEPGMFIRQGSDGDTRIFAFEQVRLAADLAPYAHVWAGIPEAYILQAANDRLVRNLLLMLLATGIALFISRLIGKKTLVAPIEALVTATERFAAGELVARDVRDEKPDELGRLRSAFYEMADSLAAGRKILQANEARFRIVMDSMDALVYVADMETYEILFLNEYARKNFGDVTGKTCWQHLQKDQQGPCPFCTNKYLLDGDEPRQEVYTWELQNSLSGRWYHLRDRAIRWVDGRLARLEIATDISDKKQAEERHKELESQLRQKFKMEAIGVMAGGIAHNFNNSLAIILGNIEVSKLKLPNDSVVLPLLENAKKAISRATELVRQILTYSHQWQIEKAPVRLSQIIDDTLKLLMPTFPSSTELKKVISPGNQELTINADPSQIQHALINLCNNALHAMAEKGTLTISLDEINLQSQDIPVHSERPPGRYAKLCVQDTGTGMSSETIEKIFDPFFTTKEAHEGTGMGLATVQGIVAQHQGLIKVRSSPAQGSIFELYFPVSESPQIETSPTERTPARGTERILFLDDDLELASSWSQILNEYGYQVTMETSSRQALQRFSTDPTAFDLVITDQTMPEVTGEEFIQEILKIRQTIPSILCTGYSHAINEEKALKLGIKAFCMKPVTRHTLLETVRRMLDGT